MSAFERSPFSAEQMQKFLTQQPNLRYEIKTFLHAWHDNCNRLYDRLVMDHNPMKEWEKNSYRYYMPVEFIPTGDGLYMPVSLSGDCISPWYPNQKFFSVYPRKKGIPLQFDPDDYLFSEIGIVFLANPEEFLRKRRDTFLYLKRAERVMSKIRLFSTDLYDFLEDLENGQEEEEEVLSTTNDIAVMSNPSLES